MTPRRLMNSLFYFTIEDESMLAEGFAQLRERRPHLSGFLLAPLLLRATRDMA